MAEEELEKIPIEIRKSIKEKKDKEYIWKYDTSKNLSEQDINRKTMAMLSYLNMEYLLNEEEKNIMKQMHEFNEREYEKSKKEKYSVDIFKDKKVQQKQEEVMLIKVEKEKWYMKLFSFLKRIKK